MLTTRSCSKAKFFLSSLACLSLLQQTELLSDYYINRCNDGLTVCTNCATGESSSPIYSDVFGSTPCGYAVTSIFFESGNDNPTLVVNTNLPSPANGGTPYYASWDMSSSGYNRYITYGYTNSSGASVELGV